MQDEEIEKLKKQVPIWGNFGAAKGLRLRPLTDLEVSALLLR